MGGSRAGVVKSLHSRARPRVDLCWTQNKSKVQCLESTAHAFRCERLPCESVHSKVHFKAYSVACSVQTQSSARSHARLSTRIVGAEDAQPYNSTRRSPYTVPPSRLPFVTCNGAQSSSINHMHDKDGHAVCWHVRTATRVYTACRQHAIKHAWMRRTRLRASAHQACQLRSDAHHVTQRKYFRTTHAHSKDISMYASSKFARAICSVYAEYVNGIQMPAWVCDARIVQCPEADGLEELRLTKIQTTRPTGAGQGITWSFRWCIAIGAHWGLAARAVTVAPSAAALTCRPDTSYPARIVDVSNALAADLGLLLYAAVRRADVRRDASRSGTHFAHRSEYRKSPTGKCYRKRA
eukprot:6174149-Pleurochrysis_carterae.AAC.1